MFTVGDVRDLSLLEENKTDHVLAESPSATAFLVCACDCCSFAHRLPCAQLSVCAAREHGCILLYSLCSMGAELSVASMGCIRMSATSTAACSVVQCPHVPSVASKRDGPRSAPRCVLLLEVAGERSPRAPRGAAHHAARRLSGCFHARRATAAGVRRTCVRVLSCASAQLNRVDV